MLTDIDETQQMHIIDRWEMTFIYFYLVIYSGMWKLLNIKDTFKFRSNFPAMTVGNMLH